ncbi:hypothetical protein CROQUDRAFT_54248 [Cronartium quercuum f. sp. fusiforme G11]|uniref:Chromo domain-containing protein n=1 Tax=Cronartium quercuum f. sp. fusiforme G11 TaxID=708437 RepID=A0A9P6N8S4_9BASI|nr:hypothetical protein CROQUDRAFT_54248 [Cronartium quercuum f. sp. fusiforme G11]
MTIMHRSGKLHNNADALSRMALPNDPSNPAWEEEDEERDMPVMGISSCDLSDEFFGGIEASYEANLNTVKLQKNLLSDKRDMSLETTLDPDWKEPFEAGKFSTISGILYHREKHTSVTLPRYLYLSESGSCQASSWLFYLIPHWSHPMVDCMTVREHLRQPCPSNFCWWCYTLLHMIIICNHVLFQSVGLLCNFINKKGIELHPTALSFHEMLAKARDHAAQCISQAMEYSKERWDKTHKTPDFKKDTTIKEVIIPFEEDTPKVVHKVLQYKRVMLEGQSTLLYLVRYKNKGADHDEWLPESKIANAHKLLHQYRIDKKS